MPRELSFLWFAISAGIVVTGILMMLMYTRKRLSAVNLVIAEAQRVIAGDRITVLERQVQRWDQLLERLQDSAWPSGICAYALVDEESNSWGLFRQDGTEKPAADVLRRYAGRNVT